MITLDWTIFVAGATFLFSLWALNRFLFQPIFSVLEKREGLTLEKEQEAAQKLEYRNALYEEYSEKIKEEKQKGYQLAETVRKEAVAKRHEKVVEARAKAEEVLANARAEVESEVNEVRDKLRRDAEELADEITKRLLEKA